MQIKLSDKLIYILKDTPKIYTKIHHLKDTPIYILKDTPYTKNT